ncbi:copper amine oxidase N-terminal domain-containing protein [Paenibacillus sp. P26]|nr:copper amine oxidase N-terminal domain-containing protein [Paenibacillus sp. P26]
MVGAALAVGSAYAGSKLNLIINEAASVPEHLEVKLEDGKVFVPIDRLAEEFKGKATYDPDKNEVRVTLPDAAKLSIQVSRLEDALKPSTPEDALDTWVKGVQTRSRSAAICRAIPRTAGTNEEGIRRTLLDDRRIQPAYGRH